MAAQAACGCDQGVGAGLAALAAGTSLSLWAFFAIIAIVLVPAHLVAGPSYLRGRAEPEVAQTSGSVERKPWMRTTWVATLAAAGLLAGCSPTPASSPADEGRRTPTTSPPGSTQWN